MTKAERELWLKFFETLGQKKRLEEFLQMLKKPDKKYKEELKAYEKLIRGVNFKMLSLLTSARAMKKSVENIRRRLDEPEYRNNILLVTIKFCKLTQTPEKCLNVQARNWIKPSMTSETPIF